MSGMTVNQAYAATAKPLKFGDIEQIEAVALLALEAEDLRLRRECGSLLRECLHFLCDLPSAEEEKLVNEIAELRRLLETGGLRL